MICNECPRRCNKPRTETKGEGFCQVGTLPIIARAALHFHEEPCISGTRGSGAIFFSGCTLRCGYCQNKEISYFGKGTQVSVKHLAEIMKRLEGEGAHNINFVTGTHFVLAILEALSYYRPKIPLLWNTSGYESLETLQKLNGIIDVYLPDIKHVSPRLSALCAKATNYFEYASVAVQTMCAQTGTPQYDAEGIVQKGTLVRHLILPSCTGDSLKVLNFIKDGLPLGTPLSLMHQYTPHPTCDIKGLDRRITQKEYERVADHMQMLDLPGYTQMAQSATFAYTPQFDGVTGVTI